MLSGWLCWLALQVFRAYVEVLSKAEATARVRAQAAFQVGGGDEWVWVGGGCVLGEGSEGLGAGLYCVILQEVGAAAPGLSWRTLWLAVLCATGFSCHLARLRLPIISGCGPRPCLFAGADAVCTGGS